MKFGDAPIKLPISNEEIDAHFEMLKAAGISMEEVYDTLLGEGLEAFEKAFKEMLETLE